MCCQFLQCSSSATLIPFCTYLHIYRSSILLQCVAVCCSVLQCVAVTCSVLQCAAVSCRELQWVAVFCSVLQWVAVCCNVFLALLPFLYLSSHTQILTFRVCDIWLMTRLNLTWDADIIACASIEFVVGMTRLQFFLSIWAQIEDQYIALLQGWVTSLFF